MLVFILDAMNPGSRTAGQPRTYAGDRAYLPQDRVMALINRYVTDHRRENAGAGMATFVVRLVMLKDHSQCPSVGLPGYLVPCLRANTQQSRGLYPVRPQTDGVLDPVGLSRNGSGVAASIP